MVADFNSFRFASRSEMFLLPSLSALAAGSGSLLRAISAFWAFLLALAISEESEGDSARDAPTPPGRLVSDGGSRKIKLAD